MHEENLSPHPAAAETDLDQVRSELRLAVDRARLHLEWADIALALTQWRFEEYTRQNAAVPTIPQDLTARPVVSVLLVQPRAVGLPSAQEPPVGEIDLSNPAR